MQGSRRRADAPATGYPVNIAAHANGASYPQPPGVEDVSLREKNAKKAKQEDPLPASTQGIAASLDRVTSAKQQKAAAAHADVEEGGIRAHPAKAPEQNEFYKVCAQGQSESTMCFTVYVHQDMLSTK